MLNFILKRFLFLVPVVFALSFVTLLLINLSPGNYFDQLRLDPLSSSEMITKYETEFHINDSVFVQYFYWLKGLAQLDLGYSFTYKTPVVKVISSRLFNTFVLSFSAFVLSWLISIPLGLLAANFRGRKLDKALSFFSYTFISMPSFFFAICLVFLAANWTQLPVGGSQSVFADEMGAFPRALDYLQHMLIPLVVMTLFSVASLFRIVRANIFDVMNQTFIINLRARGISKQVILFKHVLKNALNPMITIFGMELPALISGSALIEIITGWPGLGLVMLQAVRSQDLFLVMGNMFMISILLVVGNMVADILLAMNDPRIRLGEG